jgi:predicted Zn-dependent peptidase
MVSEIHAAWRPARAGRPRPIGRDLHGMICGRPRLATPSSDIPSGGEDSDTRIGLQVPMIVRETLDNKLRLVTESMPHVRSVSIGVWLTRGSRHEREPLGGIAHFVEHMLFKGTVNRTAEYIAQTIDSIGGQLDAFTSKEYAGYYIKVLDEHLALAVDVLADIILRPAFADDDIEREKKVILEEIKMVEDTPDDLVHEMFTQTFWEGHPLGRPILGSKETVESLTAPVLRDYFGKTYVAPNLVIAAAGNLSHEGFRDLIRSAFHDVSSEGPDAEDDAPPVRSRLVTREKELEQSHICLGTRAYPQEHDDRYALYILNTLFGGSMSSRLFQNIREKRGLAYAVFSGLAAYRDAGMLTVYAGCANESVGEVVDLVVEEMRGLKNAVLPEVELRRSKDHLKGNLMLSLESTSSRMTHLARQDIYFAQHFTLDETLASIERVSAADVQRVAADLFSNGSLGATILSAPGLPAMSASRLHLD